MIKATELRIGNNIFNGVIVEIKEDHFIFNDGYSNWSSKRFNSEVLFPIPITPYCLDTLGFKEETHLYPIKNVHKEIIRLYKIGAIWVYFTNDNLHSVCTSSGSTEHSHIKYVHQLQNLYYSYKNKELTFKTTTHE